MLLSCMRSCHAVVSLGINAPMGHTASDSLSILPSSMSISTFVELSCWVNFPVGSALYSSTSRLASRLTWKKLPGLSWLQTFYHTLDTPRYRGTYHTRTIVHVYAGVLTPGTTISY